MPAAPHFPPELLDFLRDLARHNDKLWFAANKERYERVVRVSVLRFISDLGPQLATVSPCFVADPRPVGGSMFRLHRDVRFSADKRPYKTGVGSQFRHKGAARDVHAPGFYLHLEPGECFAGAGLWQPGKDQLAAVRTAIAERGGEWVAARDAVAAAGLVLGGASLQRAPRGVDPGHPLVEDLKRKDFVVAVDLADERVLAPGFLADFVGICAGAAPLMRFLCTALGLRFDG